MVQQCSIAQGCHRAYCGRWIRHCLNYAVHLAALQYTATVVVQHSTSTGMPQVLKPAGAHEIIKLLCEDIILNKRISTDLIGANVALNAHRSRVSEQFA